MNESQEIIGLMPAAGFARRVAPLPCSKEIYPVNNIGDTPRVVSSYLLESFRQANVDKVYVVLRTGKWDIPEYFTSGEKAKVNMAYVVSEPTEGVPQTINKAYPFIKDCKVLLGFPDILFHPADAFAKLGARQQSTGADLVLGLFKTDKPRKADMVSFNSDGSIENIIIKPKRTDLVYTWIIALWTPIFTEFLHNYLKNYTSSLTGKNGKKTELFIGDVVIKAINKGVATSYVTFNEGTFLDIGTPDDLSRINSNFWDQKLHPGRIKK